MKFSRFFLTLTFVAAQTSAWACSPLRIDTPQQLVEGATGIYRVRVSSVQTGSQVGFTVLSVLKGARKPSLRVRGSLTADTDPNDHAAPYTFVRPGGRHGNCFAVTYNRRKEYLLFLKNGTPYWSALAPTNEQVSGANDPWVVWVKKQLEVPVKRGAA